MTVFSHHKLCLSTFLITTLFLSCSKTQKNSTSNISITFANALKIRSSPAPPVCAAGEKHVEQKTISPQLEREVEIFHDFVDNLLEKSKNKIAGETASAKDRGRNGPSNTPIVSQQELFIWEAGVGNTFSNESLFARNHAQERVNLENEFEANNPLKRKPNPLPLLLDVNMRAEKCAAEVEHFPDNYYNTLRVLEIAFILFPTVAEFYLKAAEVHFQMVLLKIASRYATQEVGRPKNPKMPLSNAQMLSHLKQAIELANDGFVVARLYHKNGRLITGTLSMLELHEKLSSVKDKAKQFIEGENASYWAALEMSGYSKDNLFSSRMVRLPIWREELRLEYSNKDKEKYCELLKERQEEEDKYRLKSTKGAVRKKAENVDSAECSSPLKHARIARSQVRKDEDSYTILIPKLDVFDLWRSQVYFEEWTVEGGKGGFYTPLVERFSDERNEREQMQDFIKNWEASKYLKHEIGGLIEDRIKSDALSLRSAADMAAIMKQIPYEKYLERRLASESRDVVENAYNYLRNAYKVFYYSQLNSSKGWKQREILDLGNNNSYSTGATHPVGSKVLIRELHSRKDLNGRFGVINEVRPDTNGNDRYGVRVFVNDGDDEKEQQNSENTSTSTKEFAIRPVNLIPVVEKTSGFPLSMHACSLRPASQEKANHRTVDPVEIRGGMFFDKSTRQWISTGAQFYFGRKLGGGVSGTVYLGYFFSDEKSARLETDTINGANPRHHHLSETQFLTNFANAYANRLVAIKKIDGEHGCQASTRDLNYSTTLQFQWFQEIQVLERLEERLQSDEGKYFPKLISYIHNDFHRVWGTTTNGNEFIQWTRPKPIDNPAAFIVTAFIDGIPLDTVPEARYNSLMPGLLFQKLEALRAMERIGIINCDQSDKNIMLTFDDRIVFVDFGLAEFFGDSKETFRAAIRFRKPKTGSWGGREGATLLGKWCGEGAHDSEVFRNRRSAIEDMKKIGSATAILRDWTSRFLPRLL